MFWVNRQAPQHPIPMSSQENSLGNEIGVGAYLDVLALLDVDQNKFSTYQYNHPGHLHFAASEDSSTSRPPSLVNDALSEWHGIDPRYAKTLTTPIALDDLNAITNRQSPDWLRDQWWYDKPFAVQDRTRQLVFWSVDWQVYEDAESAPSATLDASFFPMNPREVKRKETNTARLHGHPEMSLMWANPARDGKLRDPPRHNASFVNKVGYKDSRRDADGRGTSFTNILYSENDGLPYAKLGTWGADRNANGAWDRGSVPANTRMNAEEVARFPFYDPVMWMKLGQ
jgi:hypothetical protein